MSNPLTDIFSNLLHPQIPRYHISVNVNIGLVKIEFNMSWLRAVTEPLKLNPKSWGLHRLNPVLNLLAFFINWAWFLSGVSHGENLLGLDSVIHHCALVNHLSVHLILDIQDYAKVRVHIKVYIFELELVVKGTCGECPWSIELSCQLNELILLARGKYTTHCLSKVHFI